jgi:hypothetical protein
MRRFRELLLLVLCSLTFASAQETAPRPGVERPGGPQAPAKKPEGKITAAEAKLLFAQVDEILQFVSKDTGLPIKRPVKRELTSREKLRKYILDRARDDEDTKRLQRASLVLKKLGLLPRAFDLDTFLRDMLEEQVAGYYDPKKKTVYLLDWIEPAGQKAILAHELTHALQDQSFDLEKAMKKTLEQEDRDKLLKARGEIEVDANEPSYGRAAVTEGQAMIVLIDYLLAPSGRTLADSPQILAMFRAQVGQPDPDSITARGPQYLRDSLVFPYTFGLDFVHEMLQRGGRDLAFSGLLGRPPLNSREVMDPEAYVAGEKIAPFRLPDMRKLLGEDYEPYDIGNIGQFDVYSLMKQFAGEKTALRVSPTWRGGVYYAAARRSGKAGNTDCAAKPADPQRLEAQRIACLAMLTETRWATPEAAQQWAQRYAGLLLVKYKFAQSLADASAKPEAEGAAAPRLCFTCPGGERWMTDEGMVAIQQQGDTVLVLETFDDATTPKLQQAALLASTPSTVHSPQ